VDVDRGAGCRRQPPMAGDVIGMVVRLEDVLYLHAHVTRLLEVLADLEAWVDYGGDAGAMIADQVGSAAEIVMCDLAKYQCVLEAPVA
jgi:hypothetical protein